MHCVPLTVQTVREQCTMRVQSGHFTASLERDTRPRITAACDGCDDRRLQHVI